MEELASGVWMVPRAFSAFGLQVGARMIVLRLGDGSLLLYSPVEVSDDDVAAIGELGQVSTILAPNRFHHLFFGPVAARFPGATRWACPGLPNKRKDLDWNGEIGVDALELPGVAWMVVEGGPLLGETVLFHEDSGTLVVADLLFNWRHHDHLPTRAYYTLNGTYGGLGTGRIIQAAIWDRLAARGSLRKILDWPVQHVAMAHGDAVRDLPPEALRTAFDWALC